MSSDGRKVKNYFEQKLNINSNTCSNFYSRPKFGSYPVRKNKFNLYEYKSLLKQSGKKQKENFLTNLHCSILHKKLYGIEEHLKLKGKYSHTEGNLREEIDTNSNKKNKGFFMTNLMQKELRKSNFFTNTQSNLLNEKVYHPFKNSKKKSKTFRKINDDKSVIHIPSYCFLSLEPILKSNKNYPEVVDVKASDLIEKVKLYRKINYINKFKKEAFKRANDMKSFDSERNSLNQYSLLCSKDLLDKFDTSFLGYNKYLKEEVKINKKELNTLKNKKLELLGEIYTISKSIEEAKDNLELLKEYRNLLICVKYKKVDFNEAEKIYNNLVEKNSRSPIALEKDSINFDLQESGNRKLILNKFNSSKKINSNIKNFITRTERNNSRKFTSNFYLNINNINNSNADNSSKNLNQNRDKKLLSQRINKNSLLFIVNPRNKPEKAQKIFDNTYLFHREMNKMGKDLLNSMKKNDNLRSDLIKTKLNFTKDKNEMEITLKNKEPLIKKYQKELEYCQEYNTELNIKINYLKTLKNNNIIIHLIYNKINEMSLNIINNSFVSYEKLFKQLKSLYSTNKKKNSKVRTLNDIFKFIYECLIIFDNLFYNLITDKINYKKNVKYKSIIEHYENKLDNEKKKANSKQKKIDENQKKIKKNQEILSKINKIVFRTKRKIPEKINLNKSLKKKLNKHFNDDFEQLLSY